MKFIDLDDLVSAADVADRLNVTDGAVGNWRTRDVGFPAPVLVVARGNMPLFSWRQIERWATTTGRLKHTDPEEGRA